MDFGSKEGCRRVGQGYCSWTWCTCISLKILPPPSPFPFLGGSMDAKKLSQWLFQISLFMLVCYLCRKHQFSYCWWAQILSSTASLGKRTWGELLGFNHFWTGFEAKKKYSINWCLIIRCTCIFQCNSFLFFFTRTFLLLQLTALNTCTCYQSLMTSSKW